MFLPTQSNSNPYLQLISQLSQAQQPQQPQQPINLLDPNKQMQQPQPERGMFGLRKPDPLAQQKMVDEIMGAEMRAPVNHWGQALLRPLMGLVKTQKDAKATEFKEGRERADANTLINAVQGVRSGMDERGNVDLAGLLAGARNPEMVNSIIGYADKRGDKRGSDFRDDRRYNRGVYEGDRQFNRGAFESDRNFGAAEDERTFNRGRMTAADERAEGKYRREMDSYSNPMTGVDGEGNEVFFQMPPDNSNDPRVLQTVRPAGTGKGQFNRKETPAEAAKSREILAARKELISIIADKGRDELNFDATGQYGELMKTARQSLPGADDPTYDTFLDVLSGKRAPSDPTANAPQGEKQKVDTGRLVPDPTNPTQNIAIPGDTPANPTVRPVPDAKTLPLQGNGSSVSPYQKRYQDLVSSAASGGVSIPLSPVPARPDGALDTKSMKPDEFYRVRGKDGRDKVVVMRADGQIEVVSN